MAPWNLPPEEHSLKLEEIEVHHSGSGTAPLLCKSKLYDAVCVDTRGKSWF
jgi:hypothetical protein